MIPAGGDTGARVVSAKAKLVGCSGIGLESLGHVVKGETVLTLRLRGDAIARHSDFEISHVGVIGCIQDANVGSESGKHETLNLKPLEEHLERRRKEGRVHRLEDKIIIFVGLKEFDDSSPAPVFRHAMFYLLAEV